jgi:hypothetical protein
MTEDERRKLEENIFGLNTEDLKELNVIVQKELLRRAFGV